MITDEGRVLLEHNAVEDIQDEDDIENFAWGDPVKEKKLGDLVRRERR